MAYFRVFHCVIGYHEGMTDSQASVPDLDLRLVRYFTVVAECRHFGRAATELRIAQPSLSRQIRQLEQRLGARLLDRTPQGSQLTEAGEVFLPRAKALLRTAAQAAAATRAAAQPSRITIGYTVGLIVTPAVRNLRRQHPDADVQTLHLDWNEPRGALLDHRVDAVVTRLPIRTDGLHVTILYEEPRVLLVAVDVSHDGAEALLLAANTPFDAIVLDIMLPGRDGLSVLRQLREQHNHTPVLLLSAGFVGGAGRADDQAVYPRADWEKRARRAEERDDIGTACYRGKVDV